MAALTLSTPGWYKAQLQELRESEYKMSTMTLADGPESFEVTVLESEFGSTVVLFAVGAGGNPERHLPLLTSLVEAGYTVVAPHFERLISSTPTESEFHLWARRLTLALNSVAQPGFKVVGLGHSMGAAALLALAGGQVWLGVEHPIEIEPDKRLERLVLLTPPTGFSGQRGSRCCADPHPRLGRLKGYHHAS